MDIEKGFYKDAEAWLYRLLELDPVLATYMGDHRWDDRLADNSAAALEAHDLEMKQMLSAFQALDTGGFSLDGDIDQTLVCQMLKSIIRDYERKQAHRRDPGYYVDQVMGGLFMLIMKNFAPLPDRLASMVGRLKMVAGVLEAGKASIVPEEVPRVWAEVAIEQARQAQPFVMTFLPSLAEGSGESLEADLKDAAANAAKAVDDFLAFLEQDVLPNARGDFAVGKDLFEELLRENHLVDYGADELIETGWRLFNETETEIETVAKEIDPAKTVQEIMEDAKADHPTAEGLLPAYQAAMESARQYVIDHDIATIPGGETLKIIETPSYLRPLLPYAAYTEGEAQGPELRKAAGYGAARSLSGASPSAGLGQSAGVDSEAHGLISLHLLHRGLGILLRGADGEARIHLQSRPAARAPEGPALARRQDHP